MSAWDDAGYDAGWGNGGGPEPGGVAGPAPGTTYYGDDTNQAGAAQDPFAYTNGSLLTPWSGHFDGSQYGGGGGGVAPFKQFSFADFNFNPRDPGTFNEQYQNPGDFAYGDYQGTPAFKAPTAADMKADPGYQARLDAGRRSMEASAAAKGVLRTGGTLKGLQKQGQDLASQEYGNVYARKSGEYDRTDSQNQYAYSTNRSNAAENFDRNVKNQQTGYQMREGSWKDNAAATEDFNRVGLDAATNTYDRNYAKARTGYEDQRAYDQSVASAAASGSATSYNRALQEYQMSRDEFYTNQDRQYSILNNEDMKGRAAAGAYASDVNGYYNNSAQNNYQQGNAQASGAVGSANAWQGAYGAIGNAAAAMGMYAYGRSQPPVQRSPYPSMTYSGVPAPSAQYYG